MLHFHCWQKHKYNRLNYSRPRCWDLLVLLSKHLSLFLSRLKVLKNMFDLLGWDLNSLIASARSFISSFTWSKKRKSKVKCTSSFPSYAPPANIDLCPSVLSLSLKFIMSDITGRKRDISGWCWRKMSWSIKQHVYRPIDCRVCLSAVLRWFENIL